MLTRFLIAHGFSRDDLSIWWTQVLTAAAAISSGVLNLPHWAGKLGIPLSETGENWITALATLLLWVSARQASSGLPSKATVEARKAYTETFMGTGDGTLK